MITRRHVLAGIAVTGAAALVTPLAWAHRAKAALTLVRWNARTSSLEVEHRLHAHDAELALNQKAGVATPDLSQTKDRARLALYVEPRFALTDLEGQPVPLTLIGAELVADYVHVYQESALAVVPAGFNVRNDILRDVFRTQLNQVNFDMRGGDPAFIRTVTFTGEDREETVRFDG